MAIYLGNGHSLVTAMLGKTTKAVRVYFLLIPITGLGLGWVISLFDIEDVIYAIYSNYS